MTTDVESSSVALTEFEPNENLAVEEICSTPEMPVIPALVFPGGAVLQTTPEAASIPSACTVTKDTLQIIQPVLAALQPILLILDLLSQVVQIFLVLIEVLGNPLKIGKLLALVPGLTSAFNRLLAMIPALPQGIVAWVSMVIGIIRVVQSGIDCAISAIRSVSQEIAALNELLQEINSTQDELISENLQRLAGCAQKNIDTQRESINLSLAPISRILCTLKAILSIIPGGAALAQQLAIPDLREVDNLDEVAQVLQGVSSILDSIADALEALTRPFGGLTIAADAFACSFDIPPIGASSPVIEPDLDRITLPTGLPITSLAVDSPDTVVWVWGSPFTAGETTIYYDTVPLSDGVRFDERGFAEVTIPADLMTQERVVQILAVNSPPGGTPPFSGLDGDVPSKESNQLELEIV